MALLSSNHNVYNTCLRILRSHGFELSMHRENEDTEIFECLWIAKKGEFELTAENPIELLGLAKVHEYVNPETSESYWWVVDGDDVFHELVDKAYPETLDED